MTTKTRDYSHPVLRLTKKVNELLAKEVHSFEELMILLIETYKLQVQMSKIVFDEPLLSKKIQCWQIRGQIALLAITAHQEALEDAQQFTNPYLAENVLNVALAVFREKYKPDFALYTLDGGAWWANIEY